MQFVQAQFSLKYEPFFKIRRYVNEIEDILEPLYTPPQTMPIPDDFAAEAPRMILNSKNGHSQISFSQIAVDFIVNFDGEYSDKFDLTQRYLDERIRMLIDLLDQIGRKNYYYFGMTYNVRLDIQNEIPTEYLKKRLGIKINRETAYEISQRIASVEDDRFFVNKQISTFREYQGKGENIPNLMDFSNSILVDEGVIVTLDINNRYAYLKTGKSVSMKHFFSDMKIIAEKLKSNIKDLE